MNITRPIVNHIFLQVTQNNAAVSFYYSQYRQYNLFLQIYFVIFFEPDLLLTYIFQFK